MTSQRRAEEKFVPDRSQIMLANPKLSMNRYRRENSQALGKEVAGQTTGQQ